MPKSKSSSLRLYLSLVLALFLCLYSCSSSKERKPNTKIKKELLSILQDPKTEFENSLIDFPMKIHHDMEFRSRGYFEIAEPEESIRTGCVIEDGMECLPTRRLLFWAINGKDNILVYEKGGRAHNIRVVHYKFNERRNNEQLISASAVYVKPQNSFDFVMSEIKRNIHVMHIRGINGSRNYIDF